MAVFAFIGFGELGSSLAHGLGRSASHELRAYVREPSQPDAASALEARLRGAGVRRSTTLAELAAGATAVLAVVPAGAARELCEQCAPLLDPGAYYVDMASAPVAHKEDGATLVAAAGALYVDAAVLGTVAASSFTVPIAVSGRGAAGWAALVAPEGLTIEVIDASAGQATLLKLLRSVYMKGRDALIVEMMLAARHYALEERVAQSIEGPGERVPFPALAERVLCSVAIHAGRRADEVLAAGDVVRAAGVEPVMACAGHDVLRRLSELGLRDAFNHERPIDAEQVLNLIEERSGRGARRIG